MSLNDHLQPFHWIECGPKRQIQWFFITGKCSLNDSWPSKQTGFTWSSPLSRYNIVELFHLKRTNLYHTCIPFTHNHMFIAWLQEANYWYVSIFHVFWDESDQTAMYHIIGGEREVIILAELGFSHNEPRLFSSICPRLPWAQLCVLVQWPEKNNLENFGFWFNLAEH